MPISKNKNFTLPTTCYPKKKNLPKLSISFIHLALLQAYTAAQCHYQAKWNSATPWRLWGGAPIQRGTIPNSECIHHYLIIWCCLISLLGVHEEQPEVLLKTLWRGWTKLSSNLSSWDLRCEGKKKGVKNSTSNPQLCLFKVGLLITDLLLQQA